MYALFHIFLYYSISLVHIDTTYHSLANAFTLQITRTGRQAVCYQWLLPALRSCVEMSHCTWSISNYNCSYLTYNPNYYVP